MGIIRSGSGQASADYVAVLAVVAFLFAAAAAVVVESDVRGAVVDGLRAGLCVVGGDVCRDADARAAGLEPCVRRDKTRHHHGGWTAGPLRGIGGDVWTVEERSDGSIAFTAANDLGGGVGSGYGVEVGAGPVSLDLMLGVEGVVTRRTGKTWVFPSQEAAEGFLDVMQRHGFDPRTPGLPAPDVEFSSTDKDVEAGLSSLGFSLAEAGAGLARSTRRDADGLTLSFDAEVAGPRLLEGVLDLGEHHAIIEVTADRRGALSKRLSVLAVRKGPRRRRLTETRITLPLLGEDDRRLARELLTAASPVLAARDLNRRLKARGIVERKVFVLEKAPTRGYKLNLGFLVKAGLADQTDHFVKRQISATVRFPGDRRDRKRVDCA